MGYLNPATKTALSVLLIRVHPRESAADIFGGDLKPCSALCPQKDRGGRARFSSRGSNE
jgi:hypothetical protein